ncbi:MAG TPA: hypothetical protein VJ486_04070, partial [Geothrix sp.]|nr:hypothetical protein [Geothrix sp.]
MLKVTIDFPWVALGLSIVPWTFLIPMLGGSNALFRTGCFIFSANSFTRFARSTSRRRHIMLMEATMTQLKSKLQAKIEEHR